MRSDFPSDLTLHFLLLIFLLNKFKASKANLNSGNKIYSSKREDVNNYRELLLV